MSKSLVWSLIAGLTLLMVTAVGASKLQDKDKKQSQEEVIDATPIQPGVMTEKQKQHSKLYKHHGTATKIQDALKLDGEFQIRSCLGFPFSLSDQPRSQADEIKRMTCTADTIVLGTVQTSASQITEGQNFLFTDYVLLVQQVLKNNSRNPIRQGAEIDVTRPGGAVLIDDKRITAIDDEILPLRRGKLYLLFLRYLPETESFASIETGESYELNGDEAQLLRYKPEGVTSPKNDAISFMNEIQAAVGVPCN